MSKKEEFKNFILNRPELIDYVESNKTTWQKLYEIYDLYGKDSDVWNKYKNTKKAKIVSKKSSSTIKIRGLKKGKTTLYVFVNGVKLKLKVKIK